MIPILEGGGVPALSASGSPVAPQNGADTGSGNSFPEILSAQGQSVATGDGEQLPPGTGDSGGNGLLPGGKKLPLSLAASEAGEGESLFVLAGIALPPEIALSDAPVAPGTSAAAPASGASAFIATGLQAVAPQTVQPSLVSDPTPARGGCRGRCGHTGAAGTERPNPAVCKGRGRPAPGRTATRAAGST